MSTLYSINMADQGYFDANEDWLSSSGHSACPMKVKAIGVLSHQNENGQIKDQVLYY